MISKRKSRELVFQALFAWFLSNRPPQTIFELHLADPYEALRKAGKPIDLQTAEFLKRLFFGVIEHWEELQWWLKEHIIGWKLERLILTDRILMSMAIYEFLYENDIPFPVTTDQYTTLAHRYSSPQSPSFVNSVLEQIRHSIEKEQITKK
jgi:N utilization substance protein B